MQSQSQECRRADDKLTFLAPMMPSTASALAKRQYVERCVAMCKGSDGRLWRRYALEVLDARLQEARKKVSDLQGCLLSHWCLRVQ